MSEPIFSIITPNFNSGDKLIATARSLDGQGVPFEYLVMDGQSGDGSMESAACLAVSRPWMRVVSEPDRGIYDGMNNAITRVTGRYILFLGAGDVLLPGVLKEVSRFLPGHDHAVIYGDVQWGAGGQTYDGEFTKVKLCYLNICHQAMFYGRDVFAKVGEYNLRYRRLSDWEFNLRCFGMRSIATRYIPVTVSIFEVGGMSADGDPLFYSEKDKLLRKYLGYRPYARYRMMQIKEQWRVRAKRLVGRMEPVAAK